MALLPHYRPKFKLEDLKLCRDVQATHTAPHVQVQRARLALLLAEEPEITNPEAGRRLGQHENWVRKWRKRWTKKGFQLKDAPRPGGPARFSPQADRPDQGHRLRAAS